MKGGKEIKVRRGLKQKRIGTVLRWREGKERERNNDIMDTYNGKASRTKMG